MKCKFCEGEISDDLLKCIYCGNTVQTEEERDKKDARRAQAHALDLDVSEKVAHEGHQEDQKQHVTETARDDAR